MNRILICGELPKTSNNPSPSISRFLGGPNKNFTGSGQHSKRLGISATLFSPFHYFAIKFVASFSFSHPEPIFFRLSSDWADSFPNSERQGLGITGSGLYRPMRFGERSVPPFLFFLLGEQTHKKGTAPLDSLPVSQFLTSNAYAHLDMFLSPVLLVSIGTAGVHVHYITS